MANDSQIEAASGSTPEGHTYEYGYKFEVNKDRDSWRDRLGSWLRKRASKIDNRTSLALRIETLPALPAEEVVGALRAGLALAQENIGRTCEMLAQEEAARQVYPHLWGEVDEKR